MMRLWQKEMRTAVRGEDASVLCNLFFCAHFPKKEYEKKDRVGYGSSDSGNHTGRM